MVEEITPYCVICPNCGHVPLTEEQYTIQMMRPDARWMCVRCGETAEWDDDWYEEWIEQEEESQT